MQKSLAPILTRANLPNKLRQIRSEIALLEEARSTDKARWDYRKAAHLERLRKLVKKLQREHIFLIVDNS